MFKLRIARVEDQPELERLIAASARALSQGDYTPRQIEAALGSAWGVDSELIRDGTYFVVESAGRIVACGGWSFRKTLFGADSQVGRQSQELDPAREAARIRAFFVHPDWARQGIGQLLLEHCEAAACMRGFKQAQLVATIPGYRLYHARGYRGEAPQTYRLPGGVEIDFIPMTKVLEQL